MAPAQHVPISAVVVSRNEAALLERALPSLAFCAEVVVVDLESTDGTAAVAEKNGARVLRRPPADSVERARAGLADEVEHDWLLFTDPDEVLPPALAEQVAALVETVEPDVALVYAPIQYRFAGRPLRGTVWGGVKRRRLLVHRSRARLSTTIYAGTELLPGMRAIELPFDGSNAIEHAWVSGYRDFVRKHRRYVRVSAEDRARSGEVTGWRVILTAPLRCFAESFFDAGGYLDGFHGFALSALWAWYSTAGEVALYRRVGRGAAA